MDRPSLLAKISLFQALSPEDRSALGDRLIERTYVQGEPVFHKGDTGSSMYLVVSGTVQIFLPPPSREAERVLLKRMKAGEHFGELALFDDKPRSASVEAAESTTLLELSREDFITSLTRSPAAVLAILSEMANRLRDTNAMLTQRAAKNAVKEVEESLTWGQRLADKVAAMNGSWTFIIFLMLFSAAWGLVNFVLSKPFDAYPYVFFNLLLALLVALQGPLIVMSQNRQAEKERAQAASDFSVNLKNEVAIETLVRELAEFRRETKDRFDRIERPATEQEARRKASA